MRNNDELTTTAQRFSSTGDLYNRRRRIITRAGALSPAPALYSWAPAYYYLRRRIITAIRPVPALAVNQLEDFLVDRGV